MITRIITKLTFIPLSIYRKTITSAQEFVTDQDNFWTLPLKSLIREFVDSESTAFFLDDEQKLLPVPNYLEIFTQKST